MKKLICVLMILSLLTLTACGVKKSEREAGSGENNEVFSQSAGQIILDTLTESAKTKADKTYSEKDTQTGSTAVTAKTTKAQQKTTDKKHGEKKILEMHYISSREPCLLLAAEENGRKLYYVDVDPVNVRTEAGTTELSKALKSELSIDDIIAFAEEKAESREMYKDGGSVQYLVSGVKILKMNTLDGNRDVYIGIPNMESLEINTVKKREVTGRVNHDVVNPKTSSAVATNGEMTLSVCAPEKIKAGEKFYLTARMTNTSDKTITYTLPCCDYMNHDDIRVIIGDSENMPFTDVYDFYRAHPEATREETLAPGEYYEETFLFAPGKGKLSYAGRWETITYDMYPAGTYHGMVFAENGAQLPFEIVIE